MSFEDSDDENEQIGLTSVSLGYAGPQTNPTSALDNHIGGLPVWLDSTAPSPDLYACDACKAPMDLLVQISAPFTNKWYDRVLYIFTCAEAACRRKEGTIKAIRGIHKNNQVETRLRSEIEEVPISAPVANLGDTLFSSSSGASNPFANPVLAPISTPAAATGSKPKKSKAKTVQCQGRYTCKDIEVEEEYLTEQDTRIPDNVVVDNSGQEDELEGAEGSSQTVDPAVEELLTSITDATFAKFIGLIDNNPDQILRYDLPLVPIAYTDDSLCAILRDSSKIPKGIKNSPRQFEVQLVPKLISELETNEMLLDGMEWGTIVVATPKDDPLPELNANGVGYAQEWVGVQWEKQVVNA